MELREEFLPRVRDAAPPERDRQHVPAEAREHAVAVAGASGEPGRHLCAGVAHEVLRPVDLDGDLRLHERDVDGDPRRGAVLDLEWEPDLLDPLRDDMVHRIRHRDIKNLHDEYIFCGDPQFSRTVEGPFSNGRDGKPGKPGKCIDLLRGEGYRVDVRSCALVERYDAVKLGIFQRKIIKL